MNIKEIEKLTMELAREQGVVGVESELTPDGQYALITKRCIELLRSSKDSYYIEQQRVDLADAVQMIILLCGLTPFPIEIMAEGAYEEAKKNKINIKEEEEND